MSLSTEQVPVKIATTDAGITLSSVYRFKEQWEVLGKAPLSKKRGPSKGVMANMKQKHTQFVITTIDSWTK